MNKQQQFTASLSSEIAAGDPPDEIMIVPAGRIPTRPHDGRDAFVNDDPDGVLRRTRELSLDIPVDYDHQIQNSKHLGGTAIAAGWIHRLFVRNGEIWGRVTWTDKAAAHIRTREYRYLSPVFQHDSERRITRILSVSLINDPALFMNALASAEISKENLNTEKNQVNDKNQVNEFIGKMKSLFKLAKEAKHEDVLSAAEAALALADERTALVEALGLKADAGISDAKTAIASALESAGENSGSGDADPAQYVPRSEFEALARSMKQLQDSGLEASASAAVDSAIAEGRITPASRDHFMAMAKTDPEGFAALAATLPVILSPHKIVNPGTPSDPEAPLTQDEKAICAATGISETDYIASRRKLADAA